MKGKYRSKKLSPAQKAKKFGAAVGIIAKELLDLIEEKNIPKFFSKKNKLLKGKTPLEVLWQEPEKGPKEIQKILDAASTGTFG